MRSTTPILAEGCGHLRNRKMSSVFWTSTTPIAEGRARKSEIVKSPQFLHIDHANPHRGSRAHLGNRSKSSVLAHRPRQSPQRVARASQKLEEVLNFCTSRRNSRAQISNRKKSSVFAHRPRQSPQRGSRGHRRTGKKSSVFGHRPTTPIPAEGVIFAGWVRSHRAALRD